MKTSDFDFDLPEAFIAQDPAVPRDTSKLMALSPVSEDPQHLVFKDIASLLGPNDVLVMNNSRVIPARILFDINGKESEIFVLDNLGEGKFQALVRPGKFFGEGVSFEINDSLKFEVLKIEDDGSRVIDFGLDFKLSDVGGTPLPPYISSSKASADQYQTVYADRDGSVAAPTAGLHFTEELLERLREKGVSIEFVTLHVGRGTFLPVKSEDISGHTMHSEKLYLSPEVAERLSVAKSVGKRIVAVGTTSVRVLESTWDDKTGRFVPGHSETEIFIFPGKYKWKAVDALITNFHLPKSTLLMLLASFLENCGSKSPIEDMKRYYEIAKTEKYRFYSFGDAMFIST